MTDKNQDRELKLEEGSFLNVALFVKNENPAPIMHDIMVLSFNPGCSMPFRQLIASDGTINGTRAGLKSLWKRDFIAHKWKNFLLFSFDIFDKNNEQEIAVHSEQPSLQTVEKNYYASRLFEKDFYGPVLLLKLRYKQDVTKDGFKTDTTRSLVGNYTKNPIVNKETNYSNYQIRDVTMFNQPSQSKNQIEPIESTIQNIHWEKIIISDNQEPKKNTENYLDYELEDLTIEEYEQSFPNSSFEEIMQSNLEEEAFNIVGVDFENNKDYGDIVERQQWMRNKEGSQNIGNRVLVRKVTEKAFNDCILPGLQATGPMYRYFSYEKYLTNDAFEYPFYTSTYSMARKCWITHELQGRGPCFYRSYSYFIRVHSFESEEAKTWGKVADSNVSRERAIKWQKEIETKLGLLQPPKIMKY